MKATLFILSVALMLSGCGSSSKGDNSNYQTVETQTPYQTQAVNNQEVKQSARSNKQNTRSHQSEQKKPNFLKGDSFDDIRTVIYDAKSGKLNNVTYICVGDSTRAESVHDGEHLFYEMRDELKEYGVNSVLLAKAGHTAREFDEGEVSPTYKDVIDEIDGDGSESIVDISLGINDYWAKDFNFKVFIEDAISKIKSQKPKTHFMLTMPNRIYNDEEMTNDLKQAYKDIASDLSIPMIDTVDDLMPDQESTPYSYYRNDGFNCHLSREGQHIIAQNVLKHILPLER